MATEAELLAAWEAANEAWQADVFNPEKEQALSAARWALHSWRRFNTPEGRAYANSIPVYKDVGNDEDAHDDD